MSDVQFIVSRLNEAPFHRNLRLVDFDEQTSDELLQTLNDVLASMDASMKADVRRESDDVRAERLTSFLSVLRCKEVPAVAGGNGDDDDDEVLRAWMERLGQGDRNVVYPILHWALASYDKLCKRAYLAPYLLPVDLPAELTMLTGGRNNNNSLSELAQRYRDLQAEFKEVHKRYEAAQEDESNRVGSALKDELGRLLDEKRQLQDRIESLRSTTRENEDANFAALLDATTQLRKEQDEELRLDERKNDQRQSHAAAEDVFRQTERRLQSLQSTSARTGATADDVLNEVRTELREMNEVVWSRMVLEKHRLQQKLASLERDRLEPARTEEDVVRMNETAKRLEAECEEARRELDAAAGQNGGNSKLGMFKQHANLAAAKLKAKQQEIKSKTEEVDSLKAVVEEIESATRNLAAALSNRDIIGPDGQPMSKVEFDAFRSAVEEKTRRCDEARQVLSDAKRESVVLQRTEQILKGRHRNIDEFLRKQEERAGVAGFREAQQRLESTSEEAAELNDMKGQALEEISSIIQSISQTLEEKKALLKPKIAELKETRQNFQQLQQLHREKKARYERLAKKLASDRSETEKECMQLQEEWLRVERNYHYLAAMEDINRCNLDKVRMEEEWRSGQATFLPDFKSLRDLYENKLTQQELLAKQLRKQQRTLKECESKNVEQRSMFVDLQKLLNLKLDTKKKQLQREKQEPSRNMNVPLDIGDAQVLVF